MDLRQPALSLTEPGRIDEPGSAHHRRRAVGGAPLRAAAHRRSIGLAVRWRHERCFVPTATATATATAGTTHDFEQRC